MRLKRRFLIFILFQYLNILIGLYLNTQKLNDAILRSVEPRLIRYLFRYFGNTCNLLLIIINTQLIIVLIMTQKTFH